MSGNNSFSSPSSSASSDSPPQFINLSVATATTLVSEISNGGAYHSYSSFGNYAVAEQSEPAQVIIERQIRGKQMIMCESAYYYFRDYLRSAGGPKEIQRAEELFKSVQIVRDERVDKIILHQTRGGPDIKLLSKIAFSTGVHYNAKTLECRSFPVEQAVLWNLFSVAYHPYRPLAERLQKPYDPENLRLLHAINKMEI
ncbi:hypothetical protein L596_014398 [Steinernema carpocapsae]|uniref:DUF1308 domain-containing protein n=1 Tax=Steinernema carpocapsae TaxID=34508 RepID=A0A4U5NBU6_STECR|nr:hypothetical protein L596_014398 [Steinernema carpocapsae]